MENILTLEVNDIIEKQREYFLTGETKDIEFRLKQLKILKKAIKENEKAIMDALYKDLHKSEFEAYATEIGYLLDSIGYFIKHLKSWTKVKRVKTPLVHLGSKSYIYSEPYGSVLIIGPFNYPLQLVLEPLTGAIAAGNCAVIKPSEYTPNVSGVIAEIIKKYFDENYIKVMEGGKEVTSQLITSPFDYIFFTGSAAVGRIVMEAAAKNLVPVTLELGGKSPCIVDKTAKINIAAERIAWGKFLNVGQTCVAPDYLLIHKDIKAEFLEKLKETVKRFYGDTLSLSQDYGRIVNERHLDRLTGLIDRDRVVYGGDFDRSNLFLSPTIMDNVSWNDRIMEDEIFGPILPVIEYEDLDEIIRNINIRPKPLSLYIFTEDKYVRERLIESISYGGGCVNDTVTHLASPYLPFGGVGHSGMGSYHGKGSFDTFSHKKSILKKSTRINIKFIYPPYNKSKVELVRKIFK